MKNLFNLTLIASICLASCSKSNTSPKPQPTNTVITIKDTVVIGNQTWASVNYNGSGGENYSNGSNNPLYGKLYTLAEAKAIVLPKGWRLPTTDDFNTLMHTLDATATDANGYYQPSLQTTLSLMSTSKWTLKNGTNTSGFNAYPAGFFNNQFEGQGMEADFITTSTLAGYPGTQANFSVYQETDSNNKLAMSSVFSDEVGAANDRGSLRFVKDN